MAIEFVIKTSAASANNNDVTTTGIDTSTADLLLVHVSNYPVAAENTLSDLVGGNSNSWNALTAETGAVQRSKWYWSKPTFVGSGHTFSLSTVTTSYPAIWVYAFRNTAASPFDQESAGATFNNVSTIQPGSATPSEDNCLVVTGISWQATVSSVGIDGGFSTPDTILTQANNIPGGASYLIQTTAAAANPNWTWTTAVNTSATLAVFKFSGGAPATPLILTPMYNPFSSKNEIISY